MVAVGAAVAAGVTVGAAVAAGVTVGAAVAAGVTVGAAVAAGVTVGAAVAAGVPVGAAVAVGVTVGACVTTGVTVGTLVTAGAGVATGMRVADGCGAGAGPAAMGYVHWVTVPGAMTAPTAMNVNGTVTLVHCTGWNVTDQKRTKAIGGNCCARHAVASGQGMILGNKRIWCCLHSTN